MKNRKIILASTILGSIAIASTGFAAWVVSTDSEKTATGNVKVETVTDNTHELTVNLNDSQNDYLSFGAVNKTATNNWLTNTDGTAENLTVTYTLTCTNKSTCDVTATIAYSTENVFAGLVSANYLVAPTVEIGTWSTNGANGTETATMTLSASWGTHFNSQNPINFYNTHNAGDEITTGKTYAEDAKEALAAIQSALNGITYTITVTATATSN